MSEHSRIRRVIGCMTGTSIDALDVALVEIEGSALSMRARLIRSLSRPLAALSAPLRSLADQQPMTAGQIARLSHDFSILHRDAIIELLAGEAVDLVSVHGQTVWHAPPTSWQMLTPAVIAADVRAPVICDLRAADLAAGGQGAPITPIADFILFRDSVESRAVLNLGGFCNFTHIPPVPGESTDLTAHASKITGGDICSCNHLLNGLSRILLGTEYDDQGRTAASGDANPDLLNELSGLLSSQGSGGRSLGSGDELASWIGSSAGRDSAPNLLRTACEAVAGSIASRMIGVDRVVVGGGGAHNNTLITAIRRRCRILVDHTDKHGVPIDMREAICMAILAALSDDSVSITIPRITGRSGGPLQSGTRTPA